MRLHPPPVFLTVMTPIIDYLRSSRPERRTALVARELARYKLRIAALSETRFSEQCQLEEVGACYTFFWSGRPKAERHDVSVAFAIRNDSMGPLPCLPQEWLTGGLTGSFLMWLSWHLHSVGSELGVVVRPGAAPAALATCTLSHLRSY
ncbi:unnamed protein product [Schistocephalus solidus]|uniref:Uncharacterized protein n=1 Tax=Schistocephalus solidus TaxID=70667 RepID=A0A183SQJ5_SCHSO|nr:unnamed protein product [Schistocephalus solidus]